MVVLGVGGSCKNIETDKVISILMKSFWLVFRTEILCAIFPILFMEVFLLSIHYIQQTLSYIFHIELVSLKVGSLPEARLVRGPLVRGPLQVVRGPVVHGPPHH